MKLVGHLTKRDLQAELALALPPQTVGALLVDALQMTDYDMAAREAFVEWNAANRERVKGVAIVTDKVVWRVVVSVMGTASHQKMRAFRTNAAAEDWLATL